MQKLFLSIICLCLGFLCFSSCTSKQGRAHSLLEEIRTRGKLIAGVKFDSKPFGYLDVDGNVKGYDIDLIRELGKRIFGEKVFVEFQQVLSSTRILALNAGNVDIVAATMTINPERKKIISFSDEYYMAGQAVVVAKDSAIKKLSDLADKTILFTLGSTSEKNIKALFPKAHYLGFKTAIDAFTALKSGRGDAMTTDDTILAGFLQDELCRFKMLPDRLSKEPYGLGFRKDSEEQSTTPFIQAVNKALSDMKKDGSLDRLNNKWMKISSPEEQSKDSALCKLPSL